MPFVSLLLRRRAAMQPTRSTVITGSASQYRAAQSPIRNAPSGQTTKKSGRNVSCTNTAPAVPSAMTETNE